MSFVVENVVENVVVNLTTRGTKEHKGGNGVAVIFGCLLLLSGCIVTPPVAPQLSENTDPFGFALAAPFFTLPPVQPSLFDEIPDEAIEYEVADEWLEDEFQYEPSMLPIITIAEQEQLLAQSLWVQNVALIKMLDDGRRPEPPKISPEERARRAQFNMLNMSAQERARQNHQQYEYVDGSVSDWRWMHRGVDRLYVTPPEQREKTVVFLQDAKYRNDPKYQVLRANAAILLGREGHPGVANFLLQLVHDHRTDYKIRCAAVEVLGHLPRVTADQLIPLLDEVKERTIEQEDRRTGEMRQQPFVGQPEIWSELLIAIAEKIDPWEHPCFLEPFYANNSTIRLENAKIWRRKSLQKQPTGSLPDKFLDIVRRETNQLVRIELIRTLGAWRVPDLFPILEADLKPNRSADVRNAAMHALADARSQEAVPMIKDQLRDPSNRAAAVAALRKLGVLDEVFKFVNDPDYRVRAEVAPAFAERRNPTTAAFAKSYLSDTRSEVQGAAVEAIGGWSIDESGPLLLIAAKSQFTNVRRRATEILAQRGISYSGFDPEDRPANQTTQYEELVHIFRELVGVDPNGALEETADGRRQTAAGNGGHTSADGIRQGSAIVHEDFALNEVRRCLDDWVDRTLPQQDRPLIERRLIAHGQRLIPLIDHLMTVEKRAIPESLDRVFAEVEPMFKEIEALKSNDLTTKQRAARELSQLGKAKGPSNIAAKRMIATIARESDPFVITSLLAAIRNAAPESVRELARMLLRSEAALLRSEACKLLAESGTGEDVPLLREALRDPNRDVVRESVLAIDALSTPANVDASVTEALKAMLLQGDAVLQTDTAAALHRLGHSEGTDALRRLAAANDNRVKLYVVQRIAGLEDPAFVPLLLRFLDDGNGSIRNEALKGLPKAAGQEIGRAGLNPHSDVSQTQQQIERWKAWGRER